MEAPILAPSAGLAAMTLVQQLIEALCDAGTLSRQQARKIFETSITIHKAVAPRETAPANKEAARLLEAVLHEFDTLGPTNR